MPHAYTEDQLVEQPAIGLFAELGWAVAGPPPTAGVAGEVRDAGLLGRETKGELVLVSRLRAALERLNPGPHGPSRAAAQGHHRRDHSNFSLGHCFHCPQTRISNPTSKLMKSKLIPRILAMTAGVIITLGFAPATTFAQGTALTYQGRLNDGAGAANGSYDVRFAIYDALTLGTQQGPILTNSATAVSNGLFTVALDFGNQFPGADRWLEIAVRTNGGGAFATLNPRQPITATPYAICAASAASATTAAVVTGSVPASQITGTLADAQLSANVALRGGGNAFTGNQTIIGGSVGIGTTSPGSSLEVAGGVRTRGGAPGALGLNNNGYAFSGNGGDTDSGLFSSADGQLEFYGNSAERMRIASTGNVGIGTATPSATLDVAGAIKAAALVVNGDMSVTGNFKGGYEGNGISNGVVGAFIGGGGNSTYPNSVGANYGSVLGGVNNRANGLYATAMGGGSTASGGWSTAMGASKAIGDFSTAMGYLAEASGYVSTAMGGSTASGEYSIATGNSTASGNFSTAMGLFAFATNSGSFVWSDVSSLTPFTSSGANQFLIRATGGVGINTNNPGGAALAVNGDMNVTGNFKGGYAGNIISNGVVGGFIGGGGNSTYPNSVGVNYGSVLGGVNNRANGEYATAMGGGSTASGGYSTAMGASTGSGIFSTAMGVSTASGEYSIAMGNSTAGGDYSTAMGISTASGRYSFAMGESTANGNHSVAMGFWASAAHLGSFVWADSGGGFSSTADNQFCIRARGGIQLDPQTSQYFGSQTRQMLNLYGTSYGLGVQNNTTYFRSSGRFSWFAGGVHSDTETAPGAGGVQLMTLTSGGLTVNGTFVSSSDRNAKENFVPIQPRDVLEKVVALPLSSWNYKADTATRHVGPMAQDFYSAFNVGPDEKHIATVDADGVALAAIQGLNQKLEETRAENAELKQQLAELKQLVQTLVPQH